MEGDAITEGMEGDANRNGGANNMTNTTLQELNLTPLYAKVIRT